MILINKGTTNKVALSLTEKCTLSSPVFLFVFMCDITRVKKIFIASDISSYTDRYNLFNIIEQSSSEDLYNGTITLTTSGYYSYKIYEQTSSTNLTESLATNLVESGKVLVNGTTTSRAVHDNNPKQYKVHEPN